MKRRQFARMQRALFADERISKVAENPRNQAFLRTIEDRGSDDDDDMDFILAPPPLPAPAALERQDSASSAGQTATIPASQPQAASRPPTNPRRTKEGRRPANIGEIRESLSNLLDEPLNSSIIPATELGSSSESESEHPPNNSSSSNKENRPGRRAKPDAIIDRIRLKRNNSSSSSASGTTTTTTTSTTAGTGSNRPLAFAPSNNNSSTANGAAATTPFRVPALLRRATTNSLMSSSTTASSLSSTSSTAFNTNANTNHNTSTSTNTSMRIKKPAGKRSGVSYLARENERRAALAEAERRREARKVRGAEGRVRAVGGLFAAGQFE